VTNERIGRDVIHYHNCFKYFMDYLGEGALCGDITDRDYLVYMREHKPNLAQKTVNTYTKALWAVFYYMMESGWVQEFKITLPRVEETNQGNLQRFRGTGRVMPVWRQRSARPPASK
jgi:hypothetical protein